MIPAEWKARCRAPFGKILVQHRSVESIRHGLYLPPNYLGHTRTAVGTVVDIHVACGQNLGYNPGDHVMLSASGGTMIVFGLLADEESELWVYSPKAVRGVFVREIPEQIEDHGESHLRNQQSLQAKMPTVDHRSVEGDPRGLR